MTKKLIDKALAWFGKPNFDGYGWIIYDKKGEWIGTIYGYAGFEENFKGKIYYETKWDGYRMLKKFIKDENDFYDFVLKTFEGGEEIMEY